jgi:hypothetical protein
VLHSFPSLKFLLQETEYYYDYKIYINNNLLQVVSTVYYGPIFKITNPQSRITIECQEMQSDGVESIIALACTHLSIFLTLGFTCNGNVNALNITSETLYIKSLFLKGSATGLVLTCWSGDINLGNVILSLANISISDNSANVSSATITDLWGVLNFQAILLSATNLSASFGVANGKMKIGDCRLSNQLVLGNENNHFILSR